MKPRPTSRAGALRLVHSTERAPQTFDDIFERFAPYVGAIAARLLGRGDEVDDAIQDVFLVVASAGKKLPPGDELRPWLATITVRLVQKRLRKRRRWQFFGVGSDTSMVVAPNASPETQTLVRRMYEVLDTLPPSHRTAWILRHLEQETLEDVAALCGCSLATAKRWIGHAQTRLHEVFGDV